MGTHMLTGSLVALVTPMHEDGQVDYESLRRLIDWHVESETDGIVAVGTTGESATLRVDEHIAVLEAVVEYTNGRIPVIAGTGANSTAEAIELARHAKALGANKTLSVVPYYNKPTQEGIYRHFRSIAEAIDIEVILYNVPGRTVADMSNETVLRLAQLPNIIGLKDATADLSRACSLFKSIPTNFAFYSGDDATALAFMLCGGHGVISVSANIAPHAFRQMCAAALQGNVAEARKLNDSLQGLHHKLFIEPNPIPAKWALHRLGKIGGNLRLPLTPLSESAIPYLEAAMQEAGVY